MSLPLIPEFILGYELYPGQSYFCVLNSNIRRAELNHPLVKAAAEKNSKALDDYATKHPESFERVLSGWLVRKKHEPAGSVSASARRSKDYPWQRCRNKHTAVS